LKAARAAPTSPAVMVTLILMVSSLPPPITIMIIPFDRSLASQKPAAPDDLEGR